MTIDNDNLVRLSLSFHQTFVPERRCLANLMKFASQPREADTDEIADEASIPNGRVTGKVEPTINYARGMGLLDVSRGTVCKWKLQLTSLGKAIFAEDPTISENFTQWLLHLHLCRRNGGAEAWHAVFGNSKLELGNDFTLDHLKTFLTSRYGRRPRIVGPLVNMYTSESSFLKCGALTEESSRIKREPAPSDTMYYPGYYYLFFSLWDDYFVGVQQVAINYFELKSNFFAMTNWDTSNINRFINQLADDGHAKIDRQTGSAIILRTSNTETVLNELYSKWL